MKVTHAAIDRWLSLAVTLALSATLTCGAAQTPAPMWKIEKRDVRIDLLADFGLKTVSYQVDAPLEQTLADGRRQWTWRYHRAQPVVRSEESDLFSRAWHYRDQPLVLVSNFTDYADIAAAYACEAGPRSKPTPRVAALVKEIMGDTSEPRAKAERL